MVTIRTLVFARYAVLASAILSGAILIIGERSGFSRAATITTAVFHGMFWLAWVTLLCLTYHKAVQIREAAAVASRSEQGLGQRVGPEVGIPVARPGGGGKVSQAAAQVTVGGNAPPSYSEAVQAYSQVVHGVTPSVAGHGEHGKADQKGSAKM